ncbi:MAG: helix-turn-helix domain-containing protein, partial [Verrucomicrobia bacterium]|nr:helix-turn-helix domain-containing protein [Verrucomicrobiota bacterium]
MKSVLHSDIGPNKPSPKRLTTQLLAMGLSGEMTGKQLKAFRESLGLSQEELSQILRVQRVTIARAETGKYNKKQTANPDREISRLLQMLLKEALGDALGGSIAVVRQPGGEYGKKPAADIAEVKEPTAQYGKKR